MARSLIIVLGALALAGTLFFGSFAASRQVCRACVTAPSGSLDWLQKEYQLNTDEMARIQKLHTDYMVQCDSMCRMIADKKEAVQAALDNATNLNPVAQQKISELDGCRAHCQARMLQYFMDVSRMMPPDQGHRYLAEMEKDTLGAYTQIK